VYACVVCVRLHIRVSVFDCISCYIPLSKNMKEMYDKLLHVMVCVCLCLTEFHVIYLCQTFAYCFTLFLELALCPGIKIFCFALSCLIGISS